MKSYFLRFNLKVYKEEEEHFNIIYLDMKCRDLYSSWEESTDQQLDVFKNDDVKAFILI